MQLRSTQGSNYDLEATVLLYIVLWFHFLETYRMQFEEAASVWICIGYAAITNNSQDSEVYSSVILHVHHRSDMLL